MKQIQNPFSRLPEQDYQCFGCSPNNRLGLQLSFFETDRQTIKALWYPQKTYEGYINVLHGGIQATLMDEIASWTVYTKCKTAGVTSEMKIKYLKPVYVNQGKISLESELIRVEGKYADLMVRLYNNEGKMAAEAEVRYVIFPEKIASGKYNYPGVEAFYENGP